MDMEGDVLPGSEGSPDSGWVTTDLTGIDGETLHDLPVIDVHPLGGCI